jgi:hypothetical protein
LGKKKIGRILLGFNVCLWINFSPEPGLIGISAHTTQGKSGYLGHRKERRKRGPYELEGKPFSQRGRGRKELMPVALAQVSPGFSLYIHEGRGEESTAVASCDAERQKGLGGLRRMEIGLPESM